MPRAADPLDDLLDDGGYVDPGNDLFVAGPFTTRVSAAILADNFLDSAHFPFLHRATFGGSDDGRPRLTVERVGLADEQTDQQMVDGAHLDGPQPTQAVYEVAAPFSVELRLDRPAEPTSSGRSPARSTTTPRCGGWSTPIRSAATSGRSPPRSTLQTAVGLEDLWILEQMEDPQHPLDVRAEVHTKADAGCLEYRRMLAELAGQVPAASDAPLARVGGAPS